MSTNELHKNDVSSLQQELMELRTEQLKLRMQKNSGESAPKPHLHKKVRRSIARIKTLISQKEVQS